eukprot:3138050-Prymnesium_polylepis.2
MCTGHRGDCQAVQKSPTWQTRRNRMAPRARAASAQGQADCQVPQAQRARGPLRHARRARHAPHGPTFRARGSHRPTLRPGASRCSEALRCRNPSTRPSASTDRCFRAVGAAPWTCDQPRTRQSRASCRMTPSSRAQNTKACSVRWPSRAGRRAWVEGQGSAKAYRQS